MIIWELIQEKILDCVTIEDILTIYTSNKIVNCRTKCLNSECNGKTSNTLSLKNGYAYCFRCHKNYNQIQATMQIFQIDFKTACKKIITDFNLPINLSGKVSREEKEKWFKFEQEKKKNELRKKNLETFTKECNKKIIKKIRRCEDWQYKISKLAIENQLKILQNIIIVDNELNRLDWLFNRINGFDTDSRYDYIFSQDRIEILRDIFKGVIII